MVDVGLLIARKVSCLFVYGLYNETVKKFRQYDVEGCDG